MQPKITILVIFSWLSAGQPFTTIFIEIIQKVVTYPILCGVFFITLGIYQSFQNAREANDTVFSALLPVAKRDVVKRRFQFVIMIELCGFALMAVLTLIRMVFLADTAVYRQNALMNALYDGIFV